MRREAVALSLVLAQTGIAFGQSRVEGSAPTNGQASGTNVPLEAPGPRTAPHAEDPSATYDVGRTPIEPKLKLKPAAEDNDNVSGRFTLGAITSYGSPYGNFASRSPMGVRLGGLYSVGIDITYGLTRHLQFAVLGDWGRVVSGPECHDCSANTLSIGPRLRYHLVEGTRFSPWLSYGMAYRRTVVDDGTKQVFPAFEPVRLELGGDYYATSVITIGPFLGLSVTRTVDAPDSLNGRWSTWLTAGLRIGFDLAGR